MGIQTEVIGRVAGVAVATTYQSGAIVRIAELASDRLRLGRRPAAARGVMILVVVLVAYVGGAALGAALDPWSAALFVPISVLVVLGVVASRSAHVLTARPSTPAAD
jgi:uncharacterized membrane protein YoaK (UPF0700 family)